MKHDQEPDDEDRRWAEALLALLRQAFPEAPHV